MFALITRAQEHCRFLRNPFAVSSRTGTIPTCNIGRSISSINSDYHSLKVSATKRFSCASQIGIAYTWSKNLTDDQTDRSTAPEDSYNIPREYGRAQFDRRQVFTANYVYELPFFNAERNFKERLLGGWQFSGLVTLQTGLPFTATTSSFDAAGLGNNPAAIAGNRPNMICDPNSGAP